MADFSFDLSWLPEFQRMEVARNLQQSLDMNFDGPSQRGARANFFKENPDCADCFDPSPAAVALRELVKQVRAGGPVRIRLAGFSKSDKVRLSQVLEQSAARPYRENNQEAGRALAQLRRVFDQQAHVPDDEYARAELAGYESSVREAASARSENARLKRPRTVGA